MNDRPYPEGVTKIIELLDQIETVDTELVEIDRLIGKAEKLQDDRRVLWTAYEKLMGEMDLQSTGNYGFIGRVTWFLSEMKRQVRNAPACVGNDDDVIGL